MKHISKYLSEAVKTGARKQHYEFPKRIDIKAIIDFLEHNGFEKYDGPLIISKHANHYNKDAYEVGFHGKLLCMYRHGDDVVFNIWLDPDKGKEEYYGNFGDFVSSPSGPSNIQQVFYKTYDEFRDVVTEHYGW